MALRIFLFFVVFIAFCLVQRIAAQTCYYPDGSTTHGFAPCVNNVSTCCGSGPDVLDDQDHVSLMDFVSLGSSVAFIMERVPINHGAHLLVVSNSIWIVSVLWNIFPSSRGCRDSFMY